jgi:hypothetical protein
MYRAAHSASYRDAFGCINNHNTQWHFLMHQHSTLLLLLLAPGDAHHHSWHSRGAHPGAAGGPQGFLAFWVEFAQVMWLVLTAQNIVVTSHSMRKAWAQPRPGFLH